MEIKKVCVVGAGRMGRQIALNAAIYGFETSLHARSDKTYQDVMQWAEEYLAGRIAKGRLTEEQVAGVKSRFFVTQDLVKACEGVDCVIESIVEVEEEKRKLFRQLSEILDENVIIATNSSFMVSSVFANDVKNPARLCNAHYYNPVLVMKFVEVVQGPHTAPETAEAVYEFCKKTGKKPVWQKKEIEGFVGNYIFEGLRLRARYLVENGYCSYQDIDISMEEGYKMSMGPFRLMDFTGVDCDYNVLKAEYEETGVKPDMFDTFEELVKKGHIGRQAGHGFYDYE